jgi:membrane protein implicated in regulation of membrane protease activity
MNDIQIGSGSWSLNKTDSWPIVRGLLWSVASMVVAAAISLLAGLQVPSQYLFLIPLANFALVSLKRYVDDNRQE